jgi:uncharacterized protein involved in type VI secretion and phage assembly
VRLLNCDGVADHDAPIWARVAVPFAGNGHGAFMLPGVGDEVVVTFLQGDPRFPIVVGSLWNGAAEPPDRLGGSGNRVDRWTIVAPRKTRIAVVEETEGQATITLSTPGAVSLTLTEANGGKIELKAGGCTLKLDTQGISLETANKVQIQASQLKCTAGQVKVDSAMADFSGAVKSLLTQATTVIANAQPPCVGSLL